MSEIERKIEPRFGCKVYLSQTGCVCISQTRDSEYRPDDELIIILQPEEALEVIGHLQATYQEALDFVPGPEVS